MTVVEGSSGASFGVGSIGLRERYVGVAGHVTPTPPSDLPQLIRRSARATRISGYVTALVVAVPLLAVGLTAGLDDAPGLGATLAAVGVFCVLSVTVALRRRYGPDGSRWQGRLEEAAAADNDWHEVEVWFVRPSLQENERSQRIALVAEPNARPHLASKLLVTSGAGLHPGRARLWSPTGPGQPALLEKDGHALWPSRPAQGRVGVMLARIAAATPLSASVLERPES